MKPTAAQPLGSKIQKGAGFCFRVFLGIIFVFQGGWLFGFLAFVAFTWVFVAFVAFHFASSAFTVPLFSHPLLSQLVFGLGFLHPQHRKFLCD